MKSYWCDSFRLFVRGSPLEWLSTYYVLLLINYKRMMCTRETRLKTQNWKFPLGMLLQFDT